MRLFCFPFAGGGASTFRGWQAALPASIEVCAVQLPGREGRIQEPPFTRIEALVAPLREALAPYFDLPFALFGHSMGAAIAHRLAVELQADGARTPLLLAVSGRQAPHLAPLEAPFYDLPRDAFLERLKALEGTPPEVLDHPELVELLLPLLRADFELNDAYRPALAGPLGKPLQVAISAFGGIDDPHVAEAAIEAWRETTSGPFRRRRLPGDHFFLRSSQAALLAALGVDVANARAGA